MNIVTNLRGPVNRVIKRGATSQSSAHQAREPRSRPYQMVHTHVPRPVARNGVTNRSTRARTRRVYSRILVHHTRHGTILREVCVRLIVYQRGRRSSRTTPQTPQRTYLRHTRIITRQLLRRSHQGNRMARRRHNTRTVRRVTRIMTPSSSIRNIRLSRPRHNRSHRTRRGQYINQTHNRRR